MALNVTGSLLMGLGAALLVERVALAPEWRGALLIGVLGAFTTFSTFSFETIALVEEGETVRAGLNMVLSVGLCVLACWAGLVLGRQL